MHRNISAFSALVVMAALLFAAAGDAAAQRINTRQVRDTLRSLNSKVDDFDYTLKFQLRSTSASRQEISDATASIDNLKQKLSVFEENLEQRRENRADVNEIVAAAQDITGFLRANPQSRRIETTWEDARRLIEQLAAAYGVTPNWDGRVSNASRGTARDPYPAPAVNRDRYPAAGTNSELTGTYRLDAGRSDRLADILRSLRLTAAQRQDLESKLESPNEIALSVQGDRVSIASAATGPMTFVADGREKRETVGGRTVRVRAEVTPNELTLTSLGGDEDYTAIFTSENGGRELKVTKRVTTGYLDETVFAESFYTKSDERAGLGITDTYAGDDDAGYSDNMPAGVANSPNPTLSQPRIGEFIVPNGAVIIGILDTPIDTKASQNNDRFRMTVQSPIEFRGAVVEGYLTGVGRSGQVSGRSNVTFNFERITLRDGRAYDFAGTLKAVKDETGDDIRVDAEGTAKGDSQTKETAKRGGIGAGLGAIIGAIAGGGKGAVLGAIIGGGAGAGTVVATGRDDVRLLPGSTLTVEASSPIANGQPQNR